MENGKIIFGAVYKIKKGSNWLLKSVNVGMHGNYFEIQNNQAYHYFLPVNANTGSGVKTYMVDTYMIDKPSYKTFEDLVSIIKSWNDPEVGSRIKARCYDYYYAGFFEVTEKTASAFELYCDLSDLKRITADEAVKYEDSDVFWNVQFYHEHNYSWNRGAEGIILAKKNASPVGEKSLEAVLSKIIHLKIDVLDYEVNDAEEELKDILEKFPQLDDEHIEEIQAAESYLKTLCIIKQLVIYSLTPYKNVVSNYIYDKK